MRHRLASPTLHAMSWIVERSISELHQALEAGAKTAVSIATAYLDRIEELDPRLRSVVEVNPEAIEIAGALDAEHKAGERRGPLHGIPILLKENIDTADAMLTTAGSLSLLTSMPVEDSTTAARLRSAGAVILGKTAMSEWAFFRSARGTSGWSARNGQVRNPYALDRSPRGSSSGSGVAASANFAAATIGTETDGSIVAPASACGVVGLKPTVGLTSRAGVIPISRSQDTVGPIARTVADAAAVLNALIGFDDRDPCIDVPPGAETIDYTSFIDAEGLNGARIGVPRSFFGRSRHADRVIEAALELLVNEGATLVELETTTLAETSGLRDAGTTVLLHEFKVDLELYLQTRTAGSPRTLAEVIEFNRLNADRELRHFGDELHELAEATDGLESDAYLTAIETTRRLSREEGLDRVIGDNELDALVAPTGPPASLIDLINGDPRSAGSSSMAAAAGYPLITVPAGAAFGLPVGITFMGTAWSEPTLIRLASALESGRGPRTQPSFLESIRDGWDPG